MEIRLPDEQAAGEVNICQPIGQLYIKLLGVLPDKVCFILFPLWTKYLHFYVQLRLEFFLLPQ